jgi:hypothetical protein
MNQLPTRGEPAGLMTLARAFSMIKESGIKQELSSLQYYQKEGEDDEAYWARLMIDIVYLVATNLDTLLPAMVKLDGSVTMEQMETASTEEALDWIERVVTENQPNLKAFTDFLARMTSQSESPKA